MYQICAKSSKPSPLQWHFLRCSSFMVRQFYGETVAMCAC